MLGEVVDEGSLLRFVEGCGAEPREENFALHNSAEQHSKPEQFSAAQSLKTRGYTTYATRVSVYRSRLRILHRTPSNMKVSAYSTCLRILHICCLQDTHTGQRLYPAPVCGYWLYPCVTRFADLGHWAKGRKGQPSKVGGNPIMYAPHTLRSATYASQRDTNSF